MNIINTIFSTSIRANFGKDKLIRLFCMYILWYKCIVLFDIYFFEYSLFFSEQQIEIGVFFLLFFVDFGWCLFKHFFLELPKLVQLPPTLPNNPPQISKSLPPHITPSILTPISIHSIIHNKKMNYFKMSMLFKCIAGFSKRTRPRPMVKVKEQVKAKIVSD